MDPSKFPLFILDKHANITCFSLSGYSEINKCQDTLFPQLKSLSVEDLESDDRMIFSTWAKGHIVKLQSLRYHYSSDQTTFKLLENCSDTLNHLDLSIGSDCESSYCFIVIY